MLAGIDNPGTRAGISDRGHGYGGHGKHYE
jgi:hypothetical protein